MSALPMNSGMFIQPKHLPPSAWLGHIPFAGWLLTSAPPSVLVELGTHYGTSYLAMCQTVAEHALQTRCFAVDTWRGDEHTGAYEDRIFLELNDYHQRHYAGFSRLLRMTFDEALPYFADGSVDLLHIDGFHTYEAVRRDFETWLPKMSASGVILFHDTAVRDRDFGVWRLWSELRQRYPGFEFGHSHGLGVLFVGPEVPPGLRFLADGLDAQDAFEFNRLFQTMGENIVNAFEIGRLNSAVEACHGEIARLTGIVDAQARRQSEVDALYAQLHGASVAQNETLLAQHETLLARHEALLARLDAMAGELQHRTGLAHGAIDALRADTATELERRRREDDSQRETLHGIVGRLEAMSERQSAVASSVEELKLASLGNRLRRLLGIRK